jgi:hypothetical protein
MVWVREDSEVRSCSTNKCHHRVQSPPHINHQQKLECLHDKYLNGYNLHGHIKGTDYQGHELGRHAIQSYTAQWDTWLFLSTQPSICLGVFF